MRGSVFNLLAESFLKRYVVKERSLVLLLRNAVLLEYPTGKICQARVT